MRNRVSIKSFAQADALTLGTFFFLYVAQSIPSSFLSTALQVLMRENHFSLSDIGLLQLVKLPWILKCFWAPVLDRHLLTMGHYKRCIISSELAYAAILLCLGWFDIRTDIYLIIALVILSMVASGTQDIATDSLAVLSFKKSDKSMVNSMQSMGSFGGTLVGSGILLMVLHRYGWQVVLPCLAAFVLMALIPLMFNWKLTITEKPKAQRAKLSDFVWFFSQKGIWKQIVFLLLYYASLIGILSMLRPYLVDNGYNMKQIGMMSGLLGTGMAFIASFFGGLWIRRMGLYRARIVMAVFTFLTTLYFVVLSYVEPTLLLVCIGIVLLWSSYGCATIVVYTSAMNKVREGREGTDFTIQTVLTHISGMLMAIISGMVADSFSYHGLFLTTLLVAVASLFYVLTLFKKDKNESSTARKI